MPHKQIRIISDTDGHKLGEAEYLDGLLHGTSRIFTKTGILRQEMQYNKGVCHGLFRSWWENGNPKEEACFENGRRVGTHTWYTPAGEILRRLTYD